MHAITSLVCFSVRQVLGVEGFENVASAVTRYFTDHSQTLPKALATANDRSWRALGVALAGDGLFDKVKVWLTASGDEKGFREQVGRFLAGKGITFEGSSTEFRSACLNELNKALKAKHLSAENLDPKEVARRTDADFRRYADRDALIKGAEEAVTQVAKDLEPQYPNLAQLLGQPTPGGPPLLVVAFSYFFRREIEDNAGLARGLLYDGQRQLFKSQQEMLAELDNLSANQAAAFDEINVTLKMQGGKFDVVFEELVRIIDILVNTRDAVLDVKAELERLRKMQVDSTSEVRSLLQDVLGKLANANMPVGEVKPRNSYSIRGEDERNAVHALLARFRQLPEGQRNQLPALLNGLGKLQIGTGEFEAAIQAFNRVAVEVNNPAAKAEAFYNAYLAALEKEQWDKALEAIKQAATLDHQRFSPFPMKQYVPVRILGAGGFGTVFLCREPFFKNREVVVKALHASDLERRLDEVFSEAHVLSELNHPAIIGVIHCSFADMEKMVRPFIVMPYFVGVSLEQFVRQHGTISPEHLVNVARQIAGGMKEAHARGILHRDLKPDNVLVRKEGSLWHVRIIDFGLAVKQEVGGGASSSAKSIIGQSMTGTAKYAPPEQLGNLTHPVGPYSDVYSFGKTCYFLLLGTPEPDDDEKAELPEGLRKLLSRCTAANNPQKRPRDFQEVLDVLNQLKNPSPPPPPPGIRIEPLQPHLTVAVGSSATALVRVARQNFNGPLTVGVEALPTMLTSAVSHIQVGGMETRIQVTAAQNALPGTTNARITVQGNGVHDEAVLTVRVSARRPGIVREHLVSSRNGRQVMVDGLRLGAEMGYCFGARVRVTDPDGDSTHEPWVFVVQNNEHSTLTCRNPSPPNWIQPGVRIRIEVQPPDRCETV